MESSSQPLTTITIHGSRMRRVAETLRQFHGEHPKISKQMRRLDSIAVVCVSDTHGRRPDLPKGDLLIHAGDLTENGSFDEVQSEVRWLSSQPHRYKIFVAGNHDVLLDSNFLLKHPKRCYGQRKTKQDLDWGTVIYLEDSQVTLEFPIDPEESVHYSGTLPNNSRKLTVFGSPWTPQYGISAFQYRPDDENFWAAKFAALDTKPNIIITHGPPKHHLDTRDFHRAGCPYLGVEIARIRPQLVVFGHIHVSYGREDVVMDSFQSAYEDVLTGWAGWGIVVWMFFLMLWWKLSYVFQYFGFKRQETTVFINAAIVGGPKNELKNSPIIVEV